MRLHGYWRSGTSHRVRIALNLKGLDYEQRTHDLRIGEHRKPPYCTLNPQSLVPALEANGSVLTQSPAILEWLEEMFLEPPLLPRGLAERAQVRAMSALIACDIHPLNNVRVLTRLRDSFAADADAVHAWIAHWISEGFKALETMIAREGGGYAFGDQPTIADCHLVPQLYSARRFGVDLSPFPSILAASARAEALPAFAHAHPDFQPDADFMV